MSGPLQAQAAGDATAPAAAGADSDPAALQQQLRAVQRELRTVGAAVEALQEQQEQQERQPAEQLHQAGEGGRAPHVAPGPGDALQQAVMRQRLAGLQAQQQELEDALRGVGVEPSVHAEDAPASGSTPGQRRPSRGRTAFVAQGSGTPADAAQAPAAAEVGAAAGGATGGGAAKGRGSGKGRKKVQFAELEEADVFEGSGPPAGGDAGGPGGALVETERDRLIRLVGAAVAGDEQGGLQRSAACYVRCPPLVPAMPASLPSPVC